MDEVGEMSLRMQALLLRFLETGEIQRVGADQRHTTVNVRLVTATNRDLLQQIRAGAFREDLYYRLNVIHICDSAAAGTEGGRAAAGAALPRALLGGCTVCRCRSCRADLMQPPAGVPLARQRP